MSEVDPGVIRRLADMHAVYRMFGHAGQLIYVGMTGKAGQRFGDHSSKRWFPQVSTITLEWHATHAQAVLAEKRAITTERPRYNVVGTPRLAVGRRGQPVAAKPVEPDQPADVLGDILKAFGDDKGLFWKTLAERLAAQIPSRWAVATAESVSAVARSQDVPSTNVRCGDKVLKGCRRADVEVAAANRILGEAVQPWER
jgi:predicted GIY-YIG superfamily endonuclease